MERGRVDAIMRRLNVAATRRGVLGLLAALTGLALEGGEARRRPKRKRKGTGQQTPGGCGGQGASCAATAPCCGGLICTSGSCVPSDLQPPDCIPPTQALQGVLDQLPPGAQITLCAGTWQSLHTLLISKDVTIVGNTNARPSVIDGGELVQVVGVHPNLFVKFENLTIRNGMAEEGAGIFNQGNLTLSNCQITGNAARLGGGIYNQGTLRLFRGAITGNSVASDSRGYYGGGIYNDGGTVWVTGTAITDNKANINESDGEGGGIYTDGGAVMLSNSLIKNNHADTWGGGIYNNGGTVAIQAGSRITSNASISGGGGIYNDDGTVMVPARNTVTGNSPDNCSGSAIAQCVG